MRCGGARRATVRECPPPRANASATFWTSFSTVAFASNWRSGGAMPRSLEKCSIKVSGRRTQHPEIYGALAMQIGRGGDGRAGRRLRRALPRRLILGGDAAARGPAGAQLRGEQVRAVRGVVGGGARPRDVRARVQARGQAGGARARRVHRRRVERLDGLASPRRTALDRRRNGRRAASRSAAAAAPSPRPSRGRDRGGARVQRPHGGGEQARSDVDARILLEDGRTTARCCCGAGAADGDDALWGKGRT